MLSRSYHTLLRLVLIGNFLSSNKEEHQTARNQQAEHDEQNDERPIRSRLDGEGIDGTVAALMTSPFVSVERNDIPLAQAYSMHGYSQYAVFPTPAAPIMSACTSPVSTIATVLSLPPLHPTTMPCGTGFSFPPFFSGVTVGVSRRMACSRHFCGVNGT